LNNIAEEGSIIVPNADAAIAVLKIMGTSR
jgi:hypothetical protein